MAANYNELVTLVRNWSNRDAEALPDTIIQDTLRYAADKAYRTLRVPPLEHIVTYNRDTLIANTMNSNNRFSSVTSLQIPGDLIEFIQIREIDASNSTVRLFNEKADIRTFRDLSAEKYSDLAFWTRESDRMLLAPGFGAVSQNLGSSGVSQSTAIELYYYRRLPALNARYERSLANYRLGLLEDANGVALPANANYTESDFNALASTVIGQEVPNWLRDENERILLFGSLAECFAYLQENEEAQKYLAMFSQEIAELNREDQMRTASGGNVQVNFNGRGLI